LTQSIIKSTKKRMKNSHLFSSTIHFHL